MKKTIKATYSFKPKKDEAVEIQEFLMTQSNFSDAIRYLIEQEIMKNGIRDIVKFIPAERVINMPMEFVFKKLDTVEDVKEPIISLEPAIENKVIMEDYDKSSNDQVVDDEAVVENSKNIIRDDAAADVVDDGSENEEIPECYL